MKLAAAVILLSAAISSAYGQTTSTTPPDTVSSSVGNIRIERLATLELPWGMALLPDGRLLITEKPGRLRIWANGRMSEPVQGVPKVVYRGTEEDQGNSRQTSAKPVKRVLARWTHPTTSCAAVWWRAADWTAISCATFR
jgi:glucose/arabinose dehydrogenase